MLIASFPSIGIYRAIKISGIKVSEIRNSLRISSGLIRRSNLVSFAVGINIGINIRIHVRIYVRVRIRVVRINLSLDRAFNDAGKSAGSRIECSLSSVGIKSTDFDLG
jgi:hypothetical protein